MLLGLLNYTASAATFTIDVDNAANVEVGYNKSMYGGIYVQFQQYNLNDGADNTITITNETSIIVRVNSGNPLAVIDEVTKNGTPVTDYNNIPVEEGMAIVIRTHQEDGAAKCTVNCDDYTLVSLTANGNPIELTSNSQQVDFTRGETFEIRHADSTKKLAEVSLNSVRQSEGFGGSYLLSNVADGDIINIRAIPAEYNVSFSFNNDRAREYVKSVEVNAVPVSDYAAGLKLQEGSNLALKIDSSITNVEVSVNGTVRTANPIFNDIAIIVDTDLDIAVTAHDVPEPEKVIAHVDVDKAANVSLYYVKPGFIPIYNENVPFELNDGTTDVEIPENVTVIYAEPAPNCQLTEVKLNDTDVEFEPLAGRYAFDVTNGMNLLIRSKALEATASFTLVCEDPSKIKINIGDTPYELTDEPEQVIKFIPETQSTLHIEAAGSDIPIKEVLHNTASVEKLGGSFGGTPYYLITDLKDNDRIEVTLPKMYNITFVYGDGANKDYIDNVIVGDSPISNFNDGFRAPEDATISIYVSLTVTGQKISANGEELTPNDLSFVSFPVKRDTEVRVERDVLSSVSRILAPGSTTDVYGVDGMLLVKDADASDLAKLPAGCYIIGGRKVMIAK